MSTVVVVGGGTAAFSAVSFLVLLSLLIKRRG